MRHSERVAESVERWRDELAALGGRDPLLSFRDLKVGTLDLAAAEPDARRQLLDGEPVLLSRLFPHEPLRTSATRSARAIRDKARELFEERGLAVSMLAVGIATWANPFVAHRPTAPVLLRSASIVARDPAETDFLVTVADDPFVNPVLLHALDTQLGLRFQADDLRDHSGQLKYPTVIERLREFAPPHVVDGFSIAHRAVLATFALEPLFLARDIDDLGAELEHHDVIAALAGDDTARATTGTAETQVAPAHLVFDTDTDQEGVIAAAAGGGHLLVSAPPGTGRTQTVAGVVAELAGRGKRILVIAQKRATVEDLIQRLASVGLEDLAVDLGWTPPSEVVRRVTDAAGRLLDAPRDHADQKQRDRSSEDADRLRAELDAYRDAMRRVREPGDMSAYDAVVALATAAESARTSVRIDPAALERAESASGLRQKLREYADLEGLTLTEDGSPWYGSEVPSPAAADALAGTVAQLRDSLIPQLRDAATRAAVEVGLTGPTTVNECLEVVELLSSVAATVKAFGPGVWSEPIDELVAATATRAARSQLPSKPGFFARRRLRRRAVELAQRMNRRQREAIHDRLSAARDQLSGWKERARDGRPPRVGQHLPKAVEAAKAIRRPIGVLTKANSRTQDLPDLPFAEAGRRLTALADDEPHLRALPRLTKLAEELAAAGLTELLDDLRKRRTRPEKVEEVLEYAQLASLLDYWRKTDPALRGFDVAEHRHLVTEFRAADQAAIRSAAQGVHRAHAARFAEVAEDHEGQADVLAGLAGARSEGPRTPRELVDMAPDISLSAVPCWVMSPLAVPFHLPPRRLFDVVVIDDAARIPVAHAIPAIARAARAIVIADDDVAVPPFATAVEPAPDPDELEGPWAGEPPESVAEVLSDALPTRNLRVPYRFRDDRLVAFAAHASYPGRLIPVPSAGGNPRVTLDLVDMPTGGDDPVDSSSAEVARVVELVLEHLRGRPHESLGVVTLGPRHAERLDAALRQALVRAPDVAGLLHEDRAEPFFVKDVERVAGDVRDAIILSLGYGRSVDGRILYRFGALGRPGGERRLAAAITRARERLMVVSTFGAGDLSVRRLTTPGSRALGEFLAYVEGGAQAFDAGQTPGVDALAQAVTRRLRHAGASVDVGYGGPGGIPVAVRHPVRRDRYVLAVETDAPDASGHGSARERERIRPGLLARLGWSVYRVWAEAWAADPDGEGKRLIQAYEDAVAAADAYDWAVAAAEADVVAGMPDEPGSANDTGDATEPALDSAPDAEDAEQPATTAENPPTDDLGEAEQAGEAEPEPLRDGARPELTPGRPLPDYSVRDIAAMARWIESDGMSRRELEVVDIVVDELGLPVDDSRTRDLVRHAVRVARAGAPAS